MEADIRGTLDLSGKSRKSKVAKCDKKLVNQGNSFSILSSNTFSRIKSFQLREITFRLSCDHGLAAVGIVGACGGRVARVEQISSAQIEFCARLPLRMFGQSHFDRTKFYRVSRPQGRTSRGACKNEMTLLA